MVGVAVTMVISKMHEKICNDLHNSQIFKKSAKIIAITKEIAKL